MAFTLTRERTFSQRRWPSFHRRGGLAIQRRELPTDLGKTSAFRHNCENCHKLLRSPPAHSLQPFSFGRRPNMVLAICLIFAIGYICITLEHTINVNKAATALITGVLCWTLFVVNTPRCSTSPASPTGSPTRPRRRESKMLPSITPSTMTCCTTPVKSPTSSSS